jgi:hypothetical protein
MRSGGISEKDAKTKADEILKYLTVLHALDQIAAGDPTDLVGKGTDSLGDARVNSSIGASWRTLAARLEDKIRKTVKSSVYKTEKVNANLTTSLTSSGVS